MGLSNRMDAYDRRVTESVLSITAGRKISIAASAQRVCKKKKKRKEEGGVGVGQKN